MAMSAEQGEKLWLKRVSDWARECAAVHSGRYDYSAAHLRVFEAGFWKVPITCPEHGPFLQRPTKHKAGQGCPVCAGNKVVSYVEDLRKHFPGWPFPENLEITNTKSAFTLTCPEHGEFTTNFNRLTSMTAKRGLTIPCPKCNAINRGKRRRTGNDQIVARLQELYPSYTFKPHEDMRVTDKIRYSCPTHGEWASQINDMFSGHGCPGCGADNRRAGIIDTRGVSPRQNVIDVWEAHGGRLIPHFKTVAGTHDKVRITCVKHGGYETNLYAAKAGAGCPKCRGRVSKAEIEITNWLRSLGENVETQVGNVLESGQIDIYLPDRGVGIEYGGLYWHGDNIQKDKGFHYRKWKDAGKAGVHLITLFEDEWRFRNEAARGVILSLLGKQDAKQARKLRVGQVEWATAADFYETHHLQGAGTPCRENIALFDGDTMISCASFRADRFGSADFELLRYATTHRVTGGLARMLAAFAEGKSGKTLVSYCDLRWFTGGTYAKNGFSCVGETGVGYWWCKHSRRYSRFKFQKHKLGAALVKFDAAKTEDENMRANGYWKIWDCGMSKWVKTL